MKLKDYYNQTFRSDLVLLFRGFEPQEFFHRLLADPDINGGRQWAFAVVADGKPAMRPSSLHNLLAVELSRARKLIARERQTE